MNNSYYLLFVDGDDNDHTSFKELKISKQDSNACITIDEDEI